MNLKNLLLFEGENTPVLEHRDINSDLWAWIMEHWAEIQHLFRSSNGAAALAVGLTLNGGNLATQLYKD